MSGLVPRISIFCAQYGQDTGNPAATFHEVRVWKKEHEPKGKPLVPLRMVRVVRSCVCSGESSCVMRLLSQIPWGDEFTWPCARELFGSNLLVLTWIKGEPLPGELMDDILKAIGLDRLSAWARHM